MGSFQAWNSSYVLPMPRVLVYRHFREASSHVGFPEEVLELSCRHLLVCVDTLGVGLLLPWFVDCDVSPAHIIPHTLLVTPVHHFLT